MSEGGAARNACAALGLRIAQFDASDDSFAGLTYPRYRALLAGEVDHARRARQIAVGAWLRGAPVGMAYVSEPMPPWPPREARTAEETVRRLLSVMVQPLLRRLGIGRLLLERAAELAAATGSLEIEAVHASTLPARTAYEGLLRSAGWSTPVLSECRIGARCRWVADSRDDWDPLMARWRARGFSADAWSDLGERDRAEIARMVRDDLPAADRIFAPLAAAQAPGAPEASVVLRRHGRIVGWLVGWPGVQPDSIYYGYGYVVPEVQRLGWLVAGMREVCERQLARLGPESPCMLLTSGSNLAMQRVLQRQFHRYADWTDSRYRSVKALPASPGGRPDRGRADDPPEPA